MMRVRPLLFAALLALAVAAPQAAHAGWFSSSSSHQPQSHGGIIPFTTFEKEQQILVNTLPCKWISVYGRDGAPGTDSRYDFLCKGGAWGTVSLMLDGRGLRDNTLSRVRLVWREWPQAVHPGGGEGMVAQQFLHYVTNRFVPANQAPSVFQSFFGNDDDVRWQSGQTLTMHYTQEATPNYVIHRLVVQGLAPRLSTDDVANLREPITQTLHPVATSAPKAEAKNQAPTAAPIISPTVPLVAIPAWHMPPISFTTPVSPAAALAMPKPVHPSSTTIQPWLKLTAVSPTSTPTPVTKSISATTPSAPAVAASSTPTTTLVTATIKDIGTAPEPLKKPTAPLPVPENMVPSAQERLNETPTNFEAYNKAQKLTEKFAAQALTKPNDDAKVKASTPAQGIPGKVAPAPVSGTALTALPTPAVNAPKAVPVSSSTAQEDPRFEPRRTLPQLKFIPKAKPLEPDNAVIDFEDEKSQL